MGFSAEDEVWQAYLATFRGRLQELGWAVGQNLRIDYRFVGDSTERTRIAAEELVALRPDVIFVSTNPVVTAVSRATPTIPIVFTWVSDSVGSGYVRALHIPEET
jgi:putative ABC transport system substrate-binding protein